MRFSHVLLTRPLEQSRELAALLAPLGLETVIQPAFSYAGMDAAAEQAEQLDRLASAGPAGLVLFTSPRAVAFGLPQLPAEALGRCRVGAIGPATARALTDAGIRVSVTSVNGYTSEALLATLEAEGPGLYVGNPEAFIIAAPGGRDKLASGLGRLGWDTRKILVYKAEPAALDKASLKRLEQADGLLSVWTSANTMNALSQRVPPATWFRICQGDWLVISGRLQRLARAFGPSAIHLAAGPGNPSILTAVRGLL